MISYKESMLQVKFCEYVKKWGIYCRISIPSRRNGKIHLLLCTSKLHRKEAIIGWQILGNHWQVITYNIWHFLHLKTATATTATAKKNRQLKPNIQKSWDLQLIENKNWLDYISGTIL